jgi:hypothetical protein
VLPKVENPVPETIGLDTIIAIGAAVGMVCLVLSIALRLPDRRTDALSKLGIAVGFAFGSLFYLFALIVQLLCRQ